MGTELVVVPQRRVLLELHEAQAGVARQAVDAVVEIAQPEDVVRKVGDVHAAEVTVASRHQLLRHPADDFGVVGVARPELHTRG